MFTQQQPGIAANSNSLPSEPGSNGALLVTQVGGSAARLHTHSMPLVVMTYYRTFNEWFNKHLRER